MRAKQGNSRIKREIRVCEVPASWRLKSNVSLPGNAWGCELSHETVKRAALRPHRHVAPDREGNVA